MKDKNPEGCSGFVPYDDNNLEHVSAGPDYGQPWSSSHAWLETHSVEYVNFVSDVMGKILQHSSLFLPPKNLYEEK